MRSPLVPFLVVLGLASTVVLVLLLVQTIGLRQDLEQARADLAALHAEVQAQEAGATTEEVRSELHLLETGIRDWLIATGADGGFDGDPMQPAGGGTAAEILERIEEVLARVEALDDRVTQICDGVPVC